MLVLLLGTSCNVPEPHTEKTETSLSTPPVNRQNRLEHQTIASCIQTKNSLDLMFLAYAFA